MANDKPVQFELGGITATPGVLGSISQKEMLDALERHAAGDWGEVDENDKRANDNALRDGTRLLSAYVTKSGTKLWIITEADRSSTTVLLPDEY
jgi:hypothetical protein